MMERGRENKRRANQAHAKLKKPSPSPKTKNKKQKKERETQFHTYLLIEMGRLRPILTLS